MQKHSNVLTIACIVWLIIIIVCFTVKCSEHTDDIPEVTSTPTVSAEESVETPAPTPEVTPEVIEDMPTDEGLLKEERLAEFTEAYDILKRVCIAEAGNQGYDGIRAVAQVIWCRVYDTPYDFGSSIEEVLTARGQFASPYQGDTGAFEPVVDEALWAVFIDNDFYWDVPVHYFYNDSKISSANRQWFETKTYVGSIGPHVFRSEYNDS